MEAVFEDLEGCEVIVDDILAWGKDDVEHERRLVQVRKVNLKLRQEKCKIKTKKLVHIGHQLTEEGLRPDAQKVAAITGMHEPTCKKDVPKFISNLSDKAQPLRNLLKKDAP